MAFGFNNYRSGQQGDNRRTWGNTAGSRPSGGALRPPERQNQGAQQGMRQGAQNGTRINPQLGMRQPNQQGMRQPSQQQGMRQPSQQQGMRQPSQQQGMRQPSQQQGMRQPNQQQGMRQPSQQQGMPQQNPMPRAAQQAPPQGKPKTDALPDGVMYQPLDERTLDEIKRIVPNHPGLASLQGRQPEAEPPKEAPRPEPPRPEPPRPAQQGRIPMFPAPAQAAPQAAPAQAAPVQTPARNFPNLMPLDHGGSMNMPSAPVFPSLEEPPLPTAEQRLAESLGRFIQNERNGEAYYRKLGAMAETHGQADTIGAIVENCRERRAAYNSLYRKYKAADYEAVDSQVMAAVSFRQGIFQAMSEENHLIGELVKLYEFASDEARHVLSVQIYKKINDLNYLHQLMNER